jgi:hypothetical protein
MDTTQSPASPAADTPPQATLLSPEAVIEQLRAVRAQMPPVTPLTPEQRKALSRPLSIPVLQASINVIGVHQTIEQAVGQPVDEVRSLQNEWDRWTAVEDEMRSLLKGVSGANALRRQRLLFIANQAYLFGSRLSRDPANAELVPHVQQIRTLRKLSRRKKADQPPPATPASETPAEPKALK